MSVQDTQKLDGGVKLDFKNGNREAVVDCGKCKPLQPKVIRHLRQQAQKWDLKLTFVVDSEGHRVVKCKSGKRNTRVMETFARRVEAFLADCLHFLKPARTAVPKTAIIAAN